MARREATDKPWKLSRKQIIKDLEGLIKEHGLSPAGNGEPLKALKQGT